MARRRRAYLRGHRVTGQFAQPQPTRARCGTRRLNAGHRLGEPDAVRLMGAGPGRDLGPGHLPPQWPAPAGAAGDDLRLDLGAAEARRDAAEPQHSQPLGESSGLVSPPVTAGSIGSARAAAFARWDLGGDHAPGIRLTAPQLPQPRRGPDDDAEPAAADIPAVDTDVDSGELTAANLPQVLRVHDASESSQMRPRSRQPSRGNQDLSRGQDAHHNSMGTSGAR